jgi:hypothetical protein
MASSGKRKTTMSKLNREQRLRERRMEKEMRKATRGTDDDAPDVAAEPENLDHLDRYVDPFTGPSIATTPR